MGRSCPHCGGTSLTLSSDEASYICQTCQASHEAVDRRFVSQDTFDLDATKSYRRNRVRDAVAVVKEHKNKTYQRRSERFEGLLLDFIREQVMCIYSLMEPAESFLRTFEALLAGYSSALTMIQNRFNLPYIVGGNRVVDDSQRFNASLITELDISSKEVAKVDKFLQGEFLLNSNLPNGLTYCGSLTIKFMVSASLPLVYAFLILAYSLSGAIVTPLNISLTIQREFSRSIKIPIKLLFKSLRSLVFMEHRATSTVHTLAAILMPINTRYSYYLPPKLIFETRLDIVRLVFPEEPLFGNVLNIACALADALPRPLLAGIAFFREPLEEVPSSITRLLSSLDAYAFLSLGTALTIAIEMLPEDYAVSEEVGVGPLGEIVPFSSPAQQQSSSHRHQTFDYFVQQCQALRYADVLQNQGRRQSVWSLSTYHDVSRQLREALYHLIGKVSWIHSDTFHSQSFNDRVADAAPSNSLTSVNVPQTLRDPYSILEDRHMPLTKRTFYYKCLTLFALLSEDSYEDFLIRLSSFMHSLFDGDSR